MTTLRLDRVLQIDDDHSTQASVVVEAHSGLTKGWVARLGKGTLKAPEREFFTSSSDALSRAGNGTKTFTDIGPGIFEAESQWRSSQYQRVLFEVGEDGSIIVLADRTLGVGEKPLEWDALDELIARFEGFNDVEALRAERNRIKAVRQAEQAAVATASGLTELTGSEKQIAWAVGLRNTALQAVDRLLEKVRLGLERDKSSTTAAGIAYLAATEAAAQKLRRQSTAKFWIDNRTQQASTLLNQMHGKILKLDDFEEGAGETCSNCRVQLTKATAMSGSVGLLCPDCYDIVEENM